MSRSAAQLIRKDLPIRPPKPPTRPPTPGGTNVPGGSTGTGMICPGNGARRRPLASPAQGGAIDETALETPAQRVLRKPSALGGKSLYLTVIEGDLKGKSFDITGIGTYTIGRKECDIVLSDEKVSRKHASIVIAREGVYSVNDLASRNGTFVNGVRLSRRNIQHNDLIRIGDSTLRFTIFNGPLPVES